MENSSQELVVFLASRERESLQVSAFGDSYQRSWLSGKPVPEPHWERRAIGMCREYISPCYKSIE